MTAEQLSEILGDDAALAFMAQRAGARVYVPLEPTERFIEECGGDITAARTLCKDYGRSFITVPVGRPWRIRKLHERGYSVRDICLAMACKRQTVLNYLPCDGMQAPDGAEPSA